MDNSRPFAFYVHMNTHIIDNKFIISPAEKAKMAETFTVMLYAFYAISDL